MLDSNILNLGNYISQVKLSFKPMVLIGDKLKHIEDLTTPLQIIANLSDLTNIEYIEFYNIIDVLNSINNHLTSIRTCYDEMDYNTEQNFKDKVYTIIGDDLYYSITQLYTINKKLFELSKEAYNSYNPLPF